MTISEHFTLEELCFSEAAARLGLDNTPTPIVIANLRLVTVVMESIRTLLGDKPIVIHHRLSIGAGQPGRGWS